MSRCVRLLPVLALALATCSALSQAAPPVVAPGSVATVQGAKAQLVIVDVVATDSAHKPIHNLKASDFTVLEDNVPQQISSFEEHVAPAQPVKSPAMPQLPPGIFTNFTPVPAGGSLNVLLLDALNTQMKDQAYVRDQLREFLKNTPTGTRIAIFALNDRLIMLQGFTSDLSLLKSVIEKTRPDSSLKLADNVGNGGTKMPSEMMTDVMGDAADMTQLVASVQQFEAIQASTDMQIRAQQTLDAMNALAHYLAGLPGRKNLIWFSGSFPLDLFPDSTIANPAAVVFNMDDEFRETTNLLTRSQVAVYPIHAAGLKTNATAIASDSGLASSGQGLAMAQTKLFQANTSDQSTMVHIAAETGGQAYYDANNLSSAVGKAIENGANYYTLSYIPSDTAENGKFRKIRVKVAQPGTNLDYREGYFAESSGAKSKRLADMAGPAPSPSSSFSRTMMRGAPDATQILLKLQVRPASNSPEVSIVKGNMLSTGPAAKAKIKGPFRRYLIDIAADARDIEITPTRDGHYQFAVDVLTFVYDSSGILINTAVQRAQGNLSPSTYANLSHVGLPFHQEISVPVNGEYFLRTSVHDMNTDHSGSVEVPLAAVVNLTPIAPVANSGATAAAH